jgi:tetratricopeptide (TPR) repeat protein
MSSWDLIKMGQALKNKRKSLGLKQENLADDEISITTISNIETGKGGVKEYRILYYCKKLGWTMDDLNQALKEEKTALTKSSPLIDLTFKSIETMLDGETYKEALKELRDLDFPANSPHLAKKKYLLGRYYLTRSWGSSKRNLSEAIKIYDQNPEIHLSNIKSACLHELGRGFAIQNNYQDALDAVNSGLKAFLPHGQRKDLLNTLLLSKAIYLEKMERNPEAEEVLKQLWGNSDINTEIYLNMSELQAILLNKRQQYDQAVGYLDGAIELARREWNYDRLFELWTTLGSTYKQMGWLEMAKKCLKTASQLEGLTRNKLMKGYNYTELGLLYLEEENFQDAKKNLERAVKICKQEGDAVRYYHALLAMGKYWEVQGDMGQAVQWFEKAFLIARDNSLLEQEKNISLVLAKVSEGNIMKHRKYLDYYYKISVRIMEKGAGVSMNYNKQEQEIPKHVKMAEPPPP